MLALKFALTLAGVLLLAAAAAIPLYNLWMRIRLTLKKSKQGTDTNGLHLVEPEPEPTAIEWRTPITLALIACLPLLIALSIVVIPSGMGGVRISQVGGTEPGTLYPGLHFIIPMIESVKTYDLRDHLFTAGITEETDKSAKEKNALAVQSREGLNIGLAITVRYRLDPRHLDHVESQLPQPVDRELVPPVVASAWRELAPGYTVQEIFSTKREEVRSRAAEVITRKLGADGILVQEVMLRDIQLPAEYAKGLEGLLLKEQEMRKWASPQTFSRSRSVLPSSRLKLKRHRRSRNPKAKPRRA
jgi:regulator of protease activity HflC (stomatin/prohibitin superfamily)